MMYWKLAIQNIRRSLRDYIIYFVTLTLTTALMYSFLALGFSSDVISMAENMSMLTTEILLMSALVAFMSSFVIGYAIRFMLGRQKKEFATYELIGMEAKTVRNLFLAENSIIGTGPFLLGSLIGTGLSDLLNQVVKNIFEVPHTYQVSFSLHAWAVTFLFFALMYSFGMFRAAKIIRHQKVIDLLYDNRKNEEYRFKSCSRSLLVVLLSIAAMVTGVICLGGCFRHKPMKHFCTLAELACSFWWVFTSCIVRFRFCCTDLQNKICTISTKKKICSSWGRLGGASILLAGQWLWWRSF